MSDDTFNKRAGTTDVGKDYESSLIANLVLQFVTKNEIPNFRISSNDVAFGQFDDVVVELECNKVKQLYAFQLKHCQKDKPLDKRTLEAKNNNFSLTKYFESFKKIKKDNCIFILFTNLKFESSTNLVLVEHKQEVTVEIEKIEDPLTLFESGHCYRFSTAPGKYKDFFDNFLLYTNQLNVKEINKEIATRFQQFFSCSEVESDNYFKFIRQWCLQDGKKHKLDRNFMQEVIVLILSNKCIKPLSFGEVSDKMKLLRGAVTTFDVTLLRDEASNKVVQLWGDVENSFGKEEFELPKKFAPLEIGDVLKDLKAVSKLLWLMGECPLIVSEDPAVYQAIRLCPNKKYILLTSKLLQELPKCSVFQNLSNLEEKKELYAHIVKEFHCLIQGKEQVSLDFLIGLNSKFKEIITPDELIEMIDGAYPIGEAKENAPIPYISRKLSVNLIDITYFKNIGMDTLIVLDCMDKLDEIKTHLGRFNLMKIETYFREEESVEFVEKFSENDDLLHKPLYHTSPCLKNFVPGPDIYIKRIASREDFEKVYQKNSHVKRCHHLKIVNETTLEWVASIGDISDLKRYRREDEFIEETELYGGRPENNVNLIAGDPGMGKSELMKNIKNNCGVESWSILLQSSDITLLCTRLEDNQKKPKEKILEDFVLETVYDKYPTFHKRAVQLFMEKDKVAYFWDALDEITTRNIKVVIKLIKVLTQKSSFQWLSSRCHLKKQLEREFNVLSKTLSQFDEAQQNSYISERLMGFHSKEKIKDIINVIRSTVTLVKHNDVLGTPLQIFMFTELFRQDRKKYYDLLQKVFSLTDLYQHIIDEKFNRYYEEKADIRAPNNVLQSVLEIHKKSMFEKYEKAGLKVLIRKEIFKQLNIDCDEFLKEIEDGADSIGLIKEVTDKLPQFLHNSYAEFFVAKYFTEHYEELKSDFEKIYFDSKYANVKFFFDLLTAKDSKAHVAVIYGNIDLLKQNPCDFNSCEDGGGRNVLQLACSWGQRFPVLRVKKIDGIYFVDNRDDDSSVRDTSDQLEILQYLLDKCDVSETDAIFKATTLAYAEKSDNIVAKLKIMLKQKKMFSTIDDQETLSILYYSAKFGYGDVINLFETVPFMKTTKENISLLHLAVVYGHENYLNKLLSVDAYKAAINEADDCGETPLYTACQNGYYGIVELLVDHGANLNAATRNGSTPLHTACLHSYENISEFLLKSGANINSVKHFKITPLHAACWNGHDTVVKFLLKNEAGVNMPTADGCTALYVASRNEHSAVVALLGHHGADINKPQEDKVTPLFVASQEGHIKNVELLLKFGADVNQRTKTGESPLYIACQNGHKTVVKMLIDSGADVEAAANNGWTPLQIASQQGHADIAEILLQGKADVNVGMAEGATPLKIAEIHGQEKVVLVLRKHSGNVNMI